MGVTRRGLLVGGVAAAGLVAVSRVASSDGAPVPICDDPYYLAPAELADGRDASAELTAWFASLPNGATADLGGLTYRCETHVKLTDRVGLTIRNGTLLRTVKTEDPNFYYPKPNPHLWLLRCSDVTVKNLTVRGTNTVADQKAGFGAYLAKYEFDAAIRAEKFTNLTVSALDADAVWGDGVQLQTGTGAVVRDSRIDRNGRQGVTIIGRNVLVDNVRVEHSRRSGFDIEPDTSVQGVGDIEIRNSYANPIGVPFAAAGVGPLNNVWIHHNTSAGPSVPIITVKPSDGARRSNWVFEDHVALGELGSPIGALRFFYTDNFAVRRVTMKVASTQSRVVLEMFSCGGSCVLEDSTFGPGGIYYRNLTPMPGQTVTLNNNTPTLQVKP